MTLSPGMNRNATQEQTTMATKTELITLRNDFHGTETRVRVPVGTTPWEAWADASPAKQARLRRLLCGAAKGNCTCGVVRMHA